MAWKGIDALSRSGKGRSLAETQVYIDALPATTWASGMTLHNTGAPNLSQWHAANAAQRILNLERYFKIERGWQSAPHAFVDDFTPIWIFTPPIYRGTHSPTWNGTRLGIEMIGNFVKGGDDDDSGRGLKVKQNTAALFAMFHTKYGWDPANIKLHKEDPWTTHKCPGPDIDKAEFIELVQEYMGHAGDHDTPALPIAATPPIAVPVRRGVVKVAANDTLNIRAESSASSKVLASIRSGEIVEILGHDMNGSTKWLRIKYGAIQGWVSARFVVER